MTDPNKTAPSKKKSNKAFKWVKRIFVSLFILIVLLVGALFAIPYFFKDQVLQTVKDAANERLLATLDFQDASLSFFRQFPKLSLSLEDYTISNMEPFEGVTLVEGESLGLSFDLMSVLRGDEALVIHSVDLEKPNVHIIVLPDGVANYDIAKPSSANPDSATSQAANFEIDLDNYRIGDGQIIYDDRSQDIYVEALALDHEGNGRFTMDVYDLDTKTNMDALTLEMDGVPYLDKTKVDLDAGFLINLKDNQYTLKDNSLLLNALRLETAGYISMPDPDEIDMDLSFNAPGNNFKELLSLIPNAFIENYDDVQASGSFNLEGSIAGKLSGNELPALNIQMDIAEGKVQYPDLPMAISDIKTNVEVRKSQGGLDLLQVNIPDFVMRVGNERVTGHFNLATPVSDPDLDAGLNGRVNLKDIQDAYPIAGVQKLGGVVAANIKAKARMSQIQAEDYEYVDVSGILDADDIEYLATGSPPVSITSAKLDFNPDKIDINEFKANLGKSDVDLVGYIENFLAYFSPEESMRGKVVLKSGMLDLNEWTATPGEASQVNYTNTAPPDGANAPFDRFDFEVDAEVGEVKYEIYEFKDAQLKGRMSANRTNIENASARIGESDMKAQGFITNTWDYVFEDGILGGEINIDSRYFDLNSFMEVPEGSQPASGGGGGTGIIPVPPRINMLVNADVKEILYTDITIKDLVGSLSIDDEVMALQNVQSRVLGGNIIMDGSYDTKDMENPYFNFKYDLSSFDFKQSFNTFNTFQTLAPIGKYIDGTFNSKLIMEGRLNPDMTPDLSTASASGFLETFDAFVEGFPAFQKVNQTLNLDILNNLDIQDTRNWFEFENGRVEIKEFDISQDGIDMKIGGSHSITQQIDYTIFAKVPREKLENNPLGGAADTGLDFLRDQAGSLGVSLEESEYVNLSIALTGSVNDPKVKVKLLGTDGEMSLADAAKEEVESRLDEEKERLEEEANARLEEEKEKLEEAAQDIRDTITDAVTEKVEEVKDDVQTQIEETIDEQIDDAAGKIDDVFGEEAKESVDEIKDQLDNWNPFGKKKKKKKD